MSHLFMKTATKPGGRTFTWASATHGTRSMTPGFVIISGAEIGEFCFLLERNRPRGIGAGGQYEYRVYHLIGEMRFPYAIVEPTAQATRQQYPEACFVVNLKTGHESAICYSAAEADAIITACISGASRGSFK